MNWEELLQVKEGEIILDKFDEGIRFIIIRGPSALCAYIGIPLDHPLSGFDYDSIPIECHGGLTFAGKGDGYRPEGYYWYGWDYGHSGDYAFYYDTLPQLTNSLSYLRQQDKKWTPDEVEKDSWSAMYSFRTLMKLAEKIVSKKYKITEQI